MENFSSKKIHVLSTKNHEKIPIVFIRNFYEKYELELIWRELDFLTSKVKLQGPEKTKSALREDGTFKKINTGIFLDDVYSNNHRNVSDILRMNRKIFDHNLMEDFVKINPLFRFIQISNSDSTLISYYENGGKYENHIDIAMLTAITYFFREPKKFSGGDLTFTDYDVTLKIENNLFVLFPSVLNHEVSEITMPDEEEFSGMGRYSMSQFISYEGR